jgi:ribosomal protein S8
VTETGAKSQRRALLALTERRKKSATSSVPICPVIIDTLRNIYIYTLVREGKKMSPIPHLAAHVTNSYTRGYARMPIQYSKTHKAIAQLLYKQGFIASWALGDMSGPFLNPIPITPNNVHSRKIWLHLKYRQGQPALQKMEIISKPSRRIFASLEELQALAAAKRVSTLMKRPALGQLTILDTPYGILELEEALKKRVGGEVLCRVI